VLLPGYAGIERAEQSECPVFEFGWNVRLNSDIVNAVTLWLPSTASV
jgi:hypothetical protein